MKWHSVMLIGLLGLALALHSTATASSFLSNSGLLAYLKFATGTFSDGQTTLTPPMRDLHKAVELDASNIGAHRGLGFVAWQNVKDSEAFVAWQKIGLMTSDYVVFGQHASDRETALRWYALAERLEPANPELWLEVGLLCRYDMLDAMCDRFLVYNRGNRLVDPDFIFRTSGWLYNRLDETYYAITDCPDLPDKQCALVHIEAVTSPHGTGWLQCFTLESGQRYIFSAWIKTETSGQWVPIYYQGSVTGEPRGHKLGGTQEGAQDWMYWEREFTAPEFDDQRACFHPVRLLDVGWAWFHSAELKIVEQ